MLDESTDTNDEKNAAHHKEDRPKDGKLTMSQVEHFVGGLKFSLNLL